MDTSGLVFDKTARTSLAFIGRRSDGSKDIMFYRHPGADMRLGPRDIQERYFQSAKVFHFGSISLGSPRSKAATWQALRYAKKHGLAVSYDPNWRADIWDNKEAARRQINAAFKYADVVKISEEEYEFITGCRNIRDCAEYILQKGPRLVIVTLGPNGFYYSDGITRGQQPGFKVNVVETLGAGDAFVAAMLAHLVRRIGTKSRDLFRIDDGWQQALTFANAAAALTTTTMGAIPALPTERDVRRFLKKRQNKPRNTRNTRKGWQPGKRMKAEGISKS